MSRSKAAPLLCPEKGRQLYGDCDFLYWHMLADFVHDPSMANLRAALAAGDPCEAFLQVHALKGLCAQLALPALERQANALCDLLRGGDPDVLPRAMEQLSLLDRLYRQTLRAIDATIMQQ